MSSRVYRMDPVIGIKQYATKIDGCYVLGDRKIYGKKQHKSENAIRVYTEDEMIDLVRAGCYVRVEDIPRLTGRRPPLVRKNLFIDGVKIT